MTTPTRPQPTPQTALVVSPSATVSVGPVVRSWMLAVAAFGLCGLLPPIAQPQDYHAFAAAHAWGGLEDAGNVLSNLAFLAVALWGALRLARLQRLTPPSGSAAVHAAAWTLVAGLVLTAGGSAWYHATPSDQSLVWDRLAMVLSFAAVLALSLQRGGPSRGTPTVLLPLTAFGCAAVALWVATGNLTPYLVLQVGGTLFIGAQALCGQHRRGAFPAAAVFAWYGTAKLLEHFDALVAEVTHGLVAGHPLKHLAAAIAAGVILHAYLRAALPDRP
ncbi:hypothetical protein [Caldimonas brevitalea]|uniref:Alkaline phytoceramidase n=1 Tax=Caldimonas brevitalea TaxID=413882 RepID=A0A0G3BJW1_9BURK|nr:hypothetical protein [Caldimonas brevitalea]AKJ29759.1 hypothetical protein AAW51_3068 [Caldimonas brevitalea]